MPPGMGRKEDGGIVIALLLCQRGWQGKTSLPAVVPALVHHF